VPALNLLLSFPLSGAGGLVLNTQWRAGIPPGTSIWLQCWTVDDDGPLGFEASAALQIIAP
jgi:hypothetical protein